MTLTLEWSITCNIHRDQSSDVEIKDERVRHGNILKVVIRSFKRIAVGDCVLCDLLEMKSNQLRVKAINRIGIAVSTIFYCTSAFRLENNVHKTFLGQSLNMMSDSQSGFIQDIRSAARMGNAEKLEALTKQYPKGDPILNNKEGDFMGLTPLHWAIASGQAKGRITCVEILINAGVDLDLTNNSGYSPLHYACSTKKSECAKLLIERGANIETTIASTGQTPLHCAASKGDEDCIRILIEKGAIVNAIDSNGDTPLHLARRFGRTECESILIDAGAETGIKNLAGEYPLDNVPLPLVNMSYE